MERVYLDYAAATPVDPRVLRTMMPYFSEEFGNPGSLHSFGQKTIAAVDMARETIARAVGADFRDIIFTASATESNVMVFRGILKRVMSCERGAMKKSEEMMPHVSCLVPRPRVIVSAIEHESVLETAHDLEEAGVDVVYLPVSKAGIVDLKALRESLSENTMLISIMYANNETGTIQPIGEIAKIIQTFHLGNPKSSVKPLFHTDASQALQFFDCDVRTLGVDLMTLSSHKIYGPKGAGALYVSEKLKSQNLMHALITGGGQEFGLRSGTENVAAIVGFAKAIELLGLREEENKRIVSLRDGFWEDIRNIYPKAEINGSLEKRLPSILNVFFPGQAAQDIVTRLDLAGIAVSSGSACRSRAMQGSYVVEAMGYGKDRARSSIRFSFGRPSKRADIKRVIGSLRKAFS
jgi:cysteine desulfurase